VESYKRFATESSPTGDDFITGSRSAIAGELPLFLLLHLSESQMFLSFQQLRTIIQKLKARVMGLRILSHPHESHPSYHDSGDASSHQAGYHKCENVHDLRVLKAQRLSASWNLDVGSLSLIHSHGPRGRQRHHLFNHRSSQSRCLY
jgi:hypothetical protein